MMSTAQNAGAAVSTIPKDRALLSQIHPDFAPLVPAVNENFMKIWIFETIEEFRSHWITTRASFPETVPLEGFDIETDMVVVSDGTAIEVCIHGPTRQEERILSVLFVLHGGGWVGGSHATEAGMSRSICVKNQVVIVSADYRRAPEFQYLTAVKNGFDAYLWILGNAGRLRIDTQKILLGGSSAGANLIAALTLKLRDEDKLGGVIGQILNIPATCHPDVAPGDQYVFESYEQNKDAPTINGTHMRWYWEQYCPEITTHYLASPVLAKCHVGLPPALIQVGGADPLRDDGIAYAQTLQASSVDTRLRIYPGLPHGFLLAVNMRAANQYYDEMVGFVTKCLNSPSR